MTPAKLLICQRKHREAMGVYELPIAQIAAMTWNMNRDQGDKETGRPAQEVRPISDFCVFKRTKKTLAAKDGPGGIHNLRGASTDAGAWKAWAKARSKQRVVVTKSKGE